jgi:hypothetical protein
VRIYRWVLLLSLACSRAPVQAPDAARFAPPVLPPGPGASGCVESRALKQFVRALELRRKAARAEALALLGSAERQVASEFAGLEPGGTVGQRYEREGKRFAVVAELATLTPPVLALGVQGNQLRALEERPQAHAVPILVCGESSCPRAERPRLPAVRTLGVELGPGEELGAPLRVSYDYWWAQVSYDRRRACPPQPAQPRAARATWRSGPSS